MFVKREGTKGNSAKLKKMTQKFLKDDFQRSGIDTSDSTFLQKLVAGEKIFVTILQSKYIVDYAAKLEPFLNSRGVTIIRVDRTNLKIKTSCGDIWFCVEGQAWKGCSFHRDNFLLGRHDFTEFRAWEDWVNAKN